MNDTTPMLFQHDLNQYASHISQDCQNYLRENRISSFREEIKQIPSEQNGHTAICSTTVQANGNTVTQYGIATPEDMDSYSATAKNLIHHASLTASQKALALVTAMPVLEAKIEQHQTINATPFATNSSRSGYPKRQKEFHHNPNKPISKSQIKTLEAMASQRGENLDALALELTGKPITDLNSPECQTLFQHFRQQ